MKVVFYGYGNLDIFKNIIILLLFSMQILNKYILLSFAGIWKIWYSGICKVSFFFQFYKHINVDTSIHMTISSHKSIWMVNINW